MASLEAKLPEVLDRRGLAAKGKRELVGTYAARGVGSSKASCQRHKRACRDLRCPRTRAVEGELPKA